MKHHLLSVLLAAVAPLPALAQAGPPVAAAPSADDAFDRVAELLVPRETLRALIEPMFRLGFDEGVARNARARTFLESHPGTRESILETVKPELVRIIDWTYDGMRSDIRDAIAAAFKPVEARALADFLTSPVGAKLYGGALQMGTERVANETLERPDQLDKEERTARLVRQMTPEDLRAIETFGNSPAAAKFGALVPQIKVISESWTRRMIEEHGDRLRQQMRDAIQQFVESQSDKR